MNWAAKDYSEIALNQIWSEHVRAVARQTPVHLPHARAWRAPVEVTGVGAGAPWAAARAGTGGAGGAGGGGARERARGVRASGGARGGA